MFVQVLGAMFILEKINHYHMVALQPRLLSTDPQDDLTKVWTQMRWEEGTVSIISAEAADLQ